MFPLSDEFDVEKSCSRLFFLFELDRMKAFLKSIDDFRCLDKLS